MSRIRVLDLAKELGLDTKTAISKLQELGVQVKNHFNAVTDADAAKLRATLRPADAAAVAKENAQKSASKFIIRRKAEAVPEQTEIAAQAESEEAVKDHEPIEDRAEEHKKNVLPKQEEPLVEEVSKQKEFEHIQEDSVTAASKPQHEDKEEAKRTMETTKQPESSFVKPQPTTLPPLPPRTTSGGAVIVRKAEPKPPQSPQQPSSFQRPFQRSNGPSNSNGSPRPPYSPQQGSGNRPTSQYGGQGSAPTSGSRPPYQGQSRPGGTGSSAGGPSQPYRGGSAGSPQSKPYVMGETTTPSTTAKDLSSRFKDRDKDREKRKVTEEEELRNSRNMARLKGGSRFQETEEGFVETEGDLSGTEEQTVRTIIPNRKKSTFSRKKEHKKAGPSNPTKASKKVIRVDGTITVNDLASEMSQKATAVIKTLMKLGMMVSINEQIDFDTATFAAQEFGFETQNASVSIQDILSKKTDKAANLTLESRPPIVTIMGHVDHGKTSLLDALRSANVAGKEAGGITQHIGAYQIEFKGQKVTFLDTPGHEAFTSMRARGAQVTDIVVLVVAADDGVMPQTAEAIAHAKAANVPILVAINKIDKPGINIDKITRELSEHGVMPEEWGGDTMFVRVSAKTHEGLDNLIESILLQAEVLNLHASHEGLAEGVVIEAKLDKARGPIATLIVTKGTLKQQDSVVVGKCMGRVRALFDDKGQKLTSAGPSTPVELVGLSDIPEAGDRFNCVANDTIAKEAVAYRIEQQRQKDVLSQRGNSMEALLSMMETPVGDKPKELSIIIKADTHGSAEAIKASIQKIETAKVKPKIILSAVGGITETDAILAKASNALIVGFNVRPDKMAAQFAEQAGIKIQFFNIIYELIESVQAAMLGTLPPTKQEKIIGHAQVRNIFSVPKMGVIAGCMVTDGKVQRAASVRIVRDSIVIYTGKVGSLKRFKDDAKEVAQGFECGISVENYNDIKVDDVFEAFVVEEIAATLN